MGKSKSHPCRHPQKAIVVTGPIQPDQEAELWCKKCSQKIYRDDEDNWAVIKQLNF